MPIHDVLIVGSGPAAMSAALTLGRASLDTLVLSAERPRNRMVKASHNLYTRDGASPGELLDAAKTQLHRYPSVRYLNRKVLRIDEDTSTQTDAARTFTAQDAQGGQHTARRVILAVGMQDDLSRVGIPDLEAVYGRSVFPCPFCDGFEHRADALAVFTLGSEPALLEHYLAMIRTLSSPQLTWFANGQPVASELREALAARDIPVELAPIQALEHQDGQLRAVVLEGGRRIPRDAGFVGGAYAQPNPLLAQLGLETEPHPMAGWPVAVSQPMGQSSRPGIYLAGDVRMGFAGLAQAAFQGTHCASGIVGELAMARWSAGGSQDGSATR